MRTRKSHVAGISAKEERLKKMREAVRDLPELEDGKAVTKKDVQTLRDANLDDLAVIAERYAASS